MTNPYTNVMGPDISNVFWALAGEVHALSFLYAECEYLYGDSSENRIAMLNRAAPVFFYRVQIVFEQELMLGICRVTDPAKSMGKDNLTVLRLPEMLDQRTAGMGTKIEIAANTACAAAGFARDWRNRWIAHNDLDLSLNSLPAKPLAVATLKSIDEAIDAIDVVLKSVLIAFGYQSAGFRNIPEHGGSNSLISILDEGLQARTLREARAEAETATEDDFEFHTRRG